jgi:HNH endonuclease
MALNCGRAATERGLCHGHYLRLIRNGDIDSGRPLSRRRNDACTVPGCPNQATARGLCSTHRTRLSKTGDLHPELPIKTVAGTGYINHGYRVVPVPAHMRSLTRGARAELEHRYVMAQMLGRPLTRDESVHHRNGDRLDNRPENLELWSRFQPRGQRISDKIAYAIALLESYLPEALAATCGGPDPD